MSASDNGAASAPPSAFWPAFWMSVVLCVSKAAQWSRPSLTFAGLYDYAHDLAASTYNDLLFALVVGVLAQALLAATARWPRVRQGIWWGLAAFGLICAGYAIASIQIFAYLRSPLTYPLWYLAGDMRSMRSSLGSFLSAWLVAGLVAGPLVYALGLRATYRRRVWTLGRGAAATALGACWIALGWWTNQGAWSERDDHLIAASPHWELMSSCLTEFIGGHTPRLEHAFQPEDLKDFEISPHSVRALPPSFGRAPRPRNIILLVLESTGAHWMSLFGSPYKTTPRLEAEAAHAMVFDNFYCHVGLTANSMVAVSLSIYPYMTWREYTVEYPDFPGVTLADLFHARGLRTAFIHSGDLEYVGQDRFLAHRGFDDVWDLRQLGPEKRLNSWGGDDRILIDGIFQWIDKDPGKPFYLMGWTVESHHPYEPGPAHQEVDFFHGNLPLDDYDLGRYLNTIHDVDAQIGRLIDGLRARKLVDDTLIVITADHGEGFGDPHRTWGHGARLYQENVRIPFLIWSPRLIPKGSRSRIIGSHVDVNPTIANIMGIAPDPSWHGRSMFDPERPPRAYFYAANDDYLLGVREGDWKYIYNLTRGRDELYELTRDPNEQHNLAEKDPDRCRRLRQRLAAWKDYVGRQLARVRAGAAGVPSY
jgi:arylsulfatase A-like enzyme